MPKTLSDIERELAAVTADANAKKKRLRNERVRIMRRENEALGAALRAAGFEGAPDDVAALVSLADEARKHGVKVSPEGANKAPEKPAESKAPEKPKPTPAPVPEKPNPAAASTAPKPAQTAPTPPKSAPKPETPASRAEASVYGQINVYGVTTKSERCERSYRTRSAAGNGIGGREAPVPYGS